MQWLWQILKNANSRIKAYCVVFVLLPNVHILNGQNNNQYRLYYFGNTAVSNNHFSFSTGIHSMPQDDWQRVELRTGNSFSLASNINLGLGQRSNMTFVDHQLTSYEFRPFQKLSIQQFPHQALLLSHRFMLEERFFINQFENNNFHARMRYRIEGNLNIKYSSNYYIRPMSELFYSFANDINSRFSQWKNTLAFGYMLNPKASIEFRYEYVLNRNESTTFETDSLNGFRIQFVQTF